MIVSAGQRKPVKRKSVKHKQAVFPHTGPSLLLFAAALTAAIFVPRPLPLRPSPSVPALPPPAVSVPPLDPREAAASADLPNPDAPLLVTHGREQGVPFILIEGGVAQTRRSARRCGVGDLVRQARAQAGLNGTFFADARLRGTDALLIGPTLCGDETQMVPSAINNQSALIGRPLVLLSPGRTRILPYDPQTMTDQSALTARLPQVTDVFLGGVWLVHGGVAADRARLDGFHIHDAEDPRRRAFFGLMPDGRPVLGATTFVAPSANLARALQAAGLREAVLLDSGFSTSLVYGRRILVTGHTSPGIPSRPIPHALVLFGHPAPLLHRPVLMAKA